MKYSILGFNQEEVLKCKTTIDVNGKEKEVCIDVNDLLILQCVADFMNRQHIYKYMINDKMYFSIQYKTLLEDLPILNIGKQALRDRIDKLVLFNLLEKEAIRNEQGSFVVFRIGTRYEQLVYNKKEEGGVYQTTQGCVENYTPKNSSTINSSTIKEKEDKSSKKDELFEQCWVAYNRKGSKAKSKVQWEKLSQKEKDKVITHIKAYVSSRELHYQQDFERYLKYKTFNDLVVTKNNVIYDPSNATNDSLFTNIGEHKNTDKSDNVVEINGQKYR